MASIEAVKPSPALPDRIRLARELRGMTQRDVVQRMEPAISAPALSQIEAGKFQASADTLLELSRVLDVPVTFFAAQWPDDDRRATFFRHLRSTSVRDRRRAAAQAVLLSDLVSALGRYVRLPDVDLPVLPITGMAADREEIDSIAGVVRSVWGLGLEPIPHVVREMERHGIIVARLSFGAGKVDAFSTRMAHRPLVLLTDDKSDNYVRSRFDGSHELGHLVMHGDVEPGSKLVETQAHTFASAFLMPTEVALDELPRRIDGASWPRLAELKRTWGISMAALLYRARSLRMISQDTHQNAMRYMSSRGWRTMEPGDRELGAPEAPLLLERSVRRAAIEAGLDIDGLALDAALPVGDIRALVEATVDRRPTIEL